MPKILQMMSSVANTVNRHDSDALFRGVDVEAVNILTPLTHYLLSMPRIPGIHPPEFESDLLVLRELVQLACLMLLSGLKKRFSLNASDMTRLRERLLSLLAAETEETTGMFNELRLWALVTSALLQSSQDRAAFVHDIRRLMIELGLRRAYEAINITKVVIWIENLEAQEEAQLVQEVDSQGTSSDW